MAGAYLLVMRDMSGYLRTHILSGQPQRALGHSTRAAANRAIGWSDINL